MDSYSARNSRPQLAALMTLFLFIAAMFGLWIAGRIGISPKPGREWFAYGSTAFFLILAGHGLMRLLDREEQLNISAKGIFYKPWSGETISWSAIGDVKLHRHPRHSQIKVQLVAPEMHPPARFASRLSWLFGKRDLAISLNGMDGNVEAARQAMNTFRKMAM